MTNFHIKCDLKFFKTMHLVTKKIKIYAIAKVPKSKKISPSLEQHKGVPFRPDTLNSVWIPSYILSGMLSGSIHKEYTCNLQPWVSRGIVTQPDAS